MSTDRHYIQPDWFSVHVFQPAVTRLTLSGISLRGSRIIEVPGRKSGLPRRNPVNLLTIDGVDYLVAPRGETDWVRNVRANGMQATLILGRRHRTYTLAELPPPERPAILRPYLRKWKWEVGQFFGGVGPDATEAELAGIADRHPVFRLTAAS